MMTQFEISGKVDMQTFICNMHISARKYSTMHVLQDMLFAY